MRVYLSSEARQMKAERRVNEQKAVAVGIHEGTLKLQHEHKKFQDSYAQLLGERSAAVELADKWRIRFWIALGVLGGYDVIFTIVRLASGHSH